MFIHIFLPFNLPPGKHRFKARNALFHRVFARSVMWEKIDSLLCEWIGDRIHD